MNPKFFKSEGEFRKWLLANHGKAESLWLGFYKPASGVAGIKQKEAVDQAICFGWIYSVIKSIDAMTYKIQFLPRKKKSAWGASTIKRVKELEKQGLMHEAGRKAFRERDRSRSREEEPEFSPGQLKLFKKNKKAWQFFAGQTPSYQRYMKYWITEAKREETKAKRLQMLIEDSASGSKLRRIVEANERLKKRFEPGQTPIEEARNVGPTTGAELRSVGIETVEQLKAIGWERAIERLCELYPGRLNLNAFTAMIGAVEDRDWRKIDPEQKAEAKALLSQLRKHL